MKTIKSILLVLMLMLAFLLVSCEYFDDLNPEDPKVDDKVPGEDDEDNDDEEKEDDENEDVEFEYDYYHNMTYVKNTNDLYEEFFDVNSKIEIKLDFKEEELALIQSDYNYYQSINSKSPIYRRVDVTITLNGKTYFYEEVGVRMKGNTSRRNFYNENDGIYDLIHYKLDFQETFDKTKYYDNPTVWEDDALRAERKSRTFAGMSKLNLKWNKNFDESFQKEIWTFNTFEEYGILAAKMTISNVKIKYRETVENLGVFFVIENIDNDFLERRLAPKHLGGDLYKVGWGEAGGGNLKINTINSIGVEDEDISYKPTYDLKTNKKTSDNRHLIDLITTLNTESDDYLQLVNMSYFLTYEAISYLSGDPDDMRNNYNNYYLYFLEDTKEMIIIPHDNDRVLGLIKDWNPSGDAQTSVSPYSPRTSTGDGYTQQNPLILKTVDKRSKNYEAINLYKNIIIDIIENSNYFNKDAFLNDYNIRKVNYQHDTIITIALVKNLESHFGSDYGNLTFNNYVDLKKDGFYNNIDNYE